MHRIHVYIALFTISLLLLIGCAAAQTSPTVADSDLEERVGATLLTLPVLSVKRGDIDVMAKNGSVTLRGCVDTKAEKDEIDLRVELIPGVKSLNNALTIGCSQ